MNKIGEVEAFGEALISRAEQLRSISVTSLMRHPVELDCSAQLKQQGASAGSNVDGAPVMLLGGIEIAVLLVEPTTQTDQLRFEMPLVCHPLNPFA